MRYPPAENERRYTVDRGHEGVRLDRFLVDRMGECSRADIQRMIGRARVRLNGRAVKAHHKVHGGDMIDVTPLPPEASGIVAEEIPLDVRYEDGDLLVISKVAGMIVHPAGTIVRGTLVNALLAHCEELSGIGGVSKPGIVHRLDRGTSGCLLVAKNDQAHRALAEQFARREVRKEYLAIVHGRLREARGVIEGLIARHPVKRKKMSVRDGAGREAVTAYETLERFDHFSYVKVRPRTGRTHQIRVHLAHLGHPVLGDDLYGSGKRATGDRLGVERTMLHAWKLCFIHPRTGRQVRVEAPLPADFAGVLEYLRRDSRDARKRGTRDGE